MAILENNFNVYEFNENGIMYVSINKHLTKYEVIRLRNFLTSEIEKEQMPIAEMLDKVGGNVSPEI